MERAINFIQLGFNPAIPRILFDQGLVSIIDEKKQVARGKFYPILREIPVFISADGKDIDSNQKISVLTYIFYEYEDTADRVKGAIIVNVKVDYLKALIQSLSTSGKIKEVLGY